MIAMPNYITLTRMLLAPIFFFIYTYHEHLKIENFPLVLMVILAISEFSDIFDGYVARKYNQETDFGKIFDPVADSVCRTSMFITFTKFPVNLPSEFIIVLLYRDGITNALRMMSALNGKAFAARLSGKIKAILQAISMFVILLLLMIQKSGFITIDELQSSSKYIFGAVVTYSVLASIEYVYHNRMKLSSAIVKAYKKNDI